VFICGQTKFFIHPLSGHLIKIAFSTDLHHPATLATVLFLFFQHISMKLLPFLLSLIFMACQPSKITHTWTANNIQPKQYKRVLVLGVMTDEDYDLKNKMENHLAGDLKELGYYAQAANAIFPPGTFVKGDTVKALAAINSKNFDAILTIVLLDKDKNRYYVPGRITNTTAYNQHSGLEKYIDRISESIHTPGYYGIETKYTWENNFYDLQSKQLIYTARSRSFDYTSKTTLAHTYGQLMAYSLIKQKILAKPDAMEE
jgi:hypothetical protein